jgi:hypothetical protein
MANVTSIQTLVDGPRKVVVKYDGILDTSDVSLTTLLDPALLSPIDINNQLATKLRIDKIFFDVEDGLALYLYWDATTDVRIVELAGRGRMDSIKYGGLTNNAGAGNTGKILVATQGWSAGTTLSFTIIVECVKQ